MNLQQLLCSFKGPSEATLQKSMFNIVKLWYNYFVRRDYMKDKIIKYIKKNKKDFITFAMTNRLFMSFIALSIIETSLLGICTLGFGTWGFQAFFFDLAVIVLIGSIGYLFKPHRQYIYFQTMLIFITAICTINAIYFTFFNSFVTIGLIETLGQVETVTDAVFDRLTPMHFVYILMPVLFYIIYRNLKSHNYFNYVAKIENSKKNFGTVMLVGVIILCMNIITLDGTDISRLIKQWNREFLVERYGVLTYQFNDAIQRAQSKLFSYFGYDEAASKFLEYYSTKEDTSKKNRYTNVFKGKNLVLIHMESLMDMFIDMKINNQEVTPTLNKLSKEGLYFSNFYSQVSTGTSSDTEFTLNASLMPALSGTVFVSYFDRNYVTLEKLLKQEGYFTFSMHGNNASMWNRSQMHPSLGYDKFYAKESFNVTKENSIGLGISDHDFFEQMIPILKDIESKNEKYMGTILTLTNHTPWDGGDAYGEFELTKTVKRVNEETGLTETVVDNYLKGTKIGDLIRGVHYADKCLGEFIDALYKNHLFDDTVIVFYGDHDAKLDPKEYAYLYNYDPVKGKLKEEGEPGYVDYDYYQNELNRNTPLIIWTKDKKYSGKFDYYMGMIDVMPTLGNMFGFKSRYALGNDIFSIKNNNTIVFPNGNFLTEKMYYNSAKGEYMALKDFVADETYIEDKKAYAEKLLDISNDIIVYNLIETEGDKLDK